MLDVTLKKKLWHFSLTIKIHIESEILVLWGPSGAGKSTVLHCLAGLTKPDEGCIVLNGTTLYASQQKINVPTRHRNIGYLFQDYALFPHLTVRNNVLYSLKTKKKASSHTTIDPLEILESFGVLHLLDRYPGQLSGGERQRVALARALAAQPQLLLLDEPFSALDKDTKTKLRQEIKNLHQQWKIPFILVTHDEADASMLGDSIITLQQGQSISQDKAVFHPKK